MFPKKLPVMKPEELKENYKRYNSNYYEQNKERMTVQLNQQKHCPYCDVEMAKYRYTRHCRSMRHQQNVLKFNDELVENDNEEE